MDIQVNDKAYYSSEDLLKIMQLLRSPDGCPWDREQTHCSLRKDLLEEAYEVADAIDCGDKDMLCEELGDLLLQVVFHAQIAQENHEFDWNAVSDGICRKLIQRHPHVFGSIVVHSEEEVLENWDTIKQKSKGQTTYTDTLKSVPKSFPALMRMQKLQKRAAKAQYSSANLADNFALLEAQLEKMKVSSEKSTLENLSDLLGEMVFSLVNISQLLGVDLELSVAESCDKFINRFSLAENQAQSQGISIEDAYSKTM